MRQSRLILALLGVVVAAPAARAQTAAIGQCATPDSIAFRGQKRVPEDQLRADVGIQPKTEINSRVQTRALRDLYATNQFENISISCEIANSKALLVFNLRERAVLDNVR